MLMQMAWILAIIGTITEVLLVHKIKYVDKAYTKGTNLLWVPSWHVDGVVWNTVGSFGLSYVQGIMFGATGLVIAVGGALGTGLSMIYFEIEKWVQNTYGFDTIFAFLKDRLAVLKACTPQIKQALLDTWGVIYWFWRVITWPIRTRRRIKNWYSNLHTQPSM